MPPSAPIILIANPENRRVDLFQHALRQAGLKPALVISYLAILEQRLRLNDFLSKGAWVRIESPGENFAVEQHILGLGGLEHAMRLMEQRGRIYHPKHWFVGFSRLMDQIATSAGAVRWFNHPVEIVSMFDKPLCKRLLRPHTLAAYPDFSGYEAFFCFAEEQAQPRFFIKLPTSSSASGVVAYEFNRRTGQEQLYSTVEMVHKKGEDQYYNSLKILKIRERKIIKNILNFLFDQGALVEPWIAKARHAGWHYDLRVMGIAGQRCHALARLSHSPMTNLHLGNLRCDTAVLGLSTLTWKKIDRLVQEVMEKFPRSLYAGLDILLPRNGQDPVLLEANAFGDLLPNLLYEGKSTYLTEIEALRRREEA